VAAGGGDRTFEVLTWLSERGMVLYVPEIEASTTVPAMPDADAAVRSLIADLTGLDPSTIRCDIRPGRPRGFSGPASFG
jgi:hypothetical protein